MLQDEGINKLMFLNFTKRQNLKLPNDRLLDLGLWVNIEKVSGKTYRKHKSETHRSFSQIIILFLCCRLSEDWSWPWPSSTRTAFWKASPLPSRSSSPPSSPISSSTTSNPAASSSWEPSLLFWQPSCTEVRLSSRPSLIQSLKLRNV